MLYVDGLCDIVVDPVRQTDVDIHLFFAQTGFQKLLDPLRFPDDQSLKFFSLGGQNDFLEPRVGWYADSLNVAVPLEQLENSGCGRAADFKHIFNVTLVDVLPLRLDENIAELAFIVNTAGRARSGPYLRLRRGKGSIFA